MKHGEYPILFRRQQVLAIREGRKHQTRRPIKPGASRERSPYGGRGDRLWVRETWGIANRKLYDRRDPRGIAFAADYPPGIKPPGVSAWRPSIFLPRWAARMVLNNRGTWIEPLGLITAGEIEIEGFAGYTRAQFFETWDTIYRGRGFDHKSKPDVWVVEFFWPDLNLTKGDRK